MATRSGAAKRTIKPPRGAADTQRIMATLFAQHPDADTALNYRTPYELLVATILSAQCTDERVNQVTPALFKRYPDAGALARATTGDLEPRIQSTGFFRAKSRALVGMASAVVEQHRGEVPRTMDELVKLPGVGRKTANVVLGHALGVPGLPVDRHVLRVSNRIGIARSDDPEVVEQQLGAALPPEQWTLTSDTLILHGRRICRPRPLCDRCPVREDCEYYRKVVLKTQRKGKGGSLPEARRAPKARSSAPRRPASDDAPLVEAAESGSLPEVRRTPKARSSAPRRPAFDNGPLVEAVESGSLPDARGATKAPSSSPRRPASDNGPLVETPERGSLPEARRATKARSSAPRRPTFDDGPLVKAAESGSLPEVRRAPRARGTGRGGGAPRQ